jgi:lipopolysaccharide/colanic/teichoic acid biosynthesis glycosyltransferase
MKLDAETKGVAWTKENDPRRLKIGETMRKWNIDEVPQFWNVLVGNMSLVGPRPERPEHIETLKEQIPHYNARHYSKPGLTGFAQVNGMRGDTDLKARVRYDLYYLENWNLFLDVYIMIRTFFTRSGAY